METLCSGRQTRNPSICRGLTKVERLYAGVLLTSLLAKVLLFLWIGLPTFGVSLLLLTEAACIAWLVWGSGNGLCSTESRISMTVLFVLWLTGAVSYWSGVLPSPHLEAWVLIGCATARLLVAIPMVVWPVTTG